MQGQSQALETLLEALLETLRDAGAWVLTGSMAFAIQGMRVTPGDLDIQTDAENAYRIGDLLKSRFPGCEMDPVALRESELVRSHLGRFTILGVKVEVMGGIQKRRPGGPWEEAPGIASLRTFTCWRSRVVPVLPLAYEQEAYARIGRLHRAEQLREFLHVPKVYVSRQLPDQAFSALSSFRVNVWPEEETPVPRDILLRECSDASGLLCLLTDRVDQELLDRCPSVKIVANMAVGYDNIDVEACTRRGVLVTNTPGVLTESTADLTFGLILATARRIPEARDMLLQGRWRTWSPMFLTGQDVHGATLGIVGFGRIGQAVARRAAGFGMFVLYYSRHRYPELEKELGVQHRPLDDLLRESDIVSLHLPLSEDTRGLIGERELALMKPSAILINTSRGPVVDERALYRALRDRRIWAAGLDVFEREPLPEDSPLRSLDNVVLLPHIGSASIKTRTAMAVLAAENVREYLLRGRALTPVNSI